MRVCLYFRPYNPDRWVRGDRHLRGMVRRLVRGKPRVGGVGRVVLNLREGLRRISVNHVMNLPYARLRPDDWVGALGVGRNTLQGYNRPNPIVAGIALMTRPDQWPTLFQDYPVAAYLQHSEWAADLYRPWFGDRCGVWPSGIDTDRWRPGSGERDFDVLVYQKTDEVASDTAARLQEAVTEGLARKGLTTRVIRYGSYEETEYLALLQSARAMVLISPHESQGFACGESLACDVPILAWDPGVVVPRPEGFDPVVSTSTPYFDDRCGVKFRTAEDFAPALDRFLDGLPAFSPRAYVMENLTLEKSATRFVDFLRAVNGG